MSQLRFDYTTSDWVVFAPLRKLRPHSESTSMPAAAGAASEATTACPFCPGNERLTPQEIHAVKGTPTAASSYWQVRVIPNRFPALRIEDDHHRHELGRVFEYMGGCGAHEVVIESPDHFAFLGQQPVEQVELVLRTIHQRYQDLMRDRRFQSIIIFKNHGLGAGTSLRHPHWQIIATPVVPQLSRQRYLTATEFFDRTGECLYCVMVAEELAAAERIVTTNSEFVAFVPYAAHLPFETWIVPRRQQASIDALAPQQFRPLAEILKTMLLKLYAALDNPDFNLTIDMAPRGDEDKEYFQWHIRILPRLATPAGFELGSGMSINTVLPEEAANFLQNGSATPLAPSIV
jgi:UDPglucose--hexose-1-phosphate uridylyltransferase